jgi:hypothetical protein
MRYKVILYEVVWEEIRLVVDYYDSISPTLGLAVENAILQALRKLETSPTYFLLLSDKKHRRIMLHQFPYMFVYAVKDDVVMVKILFPQKNDPAKLWTNLETRPA